MARQAEAHALNKLLTLTLDPKLIPAGVGSIEHIRDVWAKFRVYLRRQARERGYSKSVSYICVVELNKAGIAHMHVLIDQYIDQKWISAVWNALQGGCIVDIRQVDLHRASTYLTKYMTKTSHEMPPGTRRYSTSRSIHLFEKRPPSDWRLWKYAIELIHSRLRPNLILLEEYDAHGTLESFNLADEFSA